RQLKAEIYQHIYEEIEKLTPHLKKVFQMAYIEGMSNEEIAQQLGINNQSVRNDKSRALKQIRLAMMDKDIFGLLLLWLALHKVRETVRQMYKSRERTWQRIEEKLPDEKVVSIKRRPFWKWVAAAAIVLFLVAGYWLLRETPTDKNIAKEEERFKNDVSAPQH